MSRREGASNRGRNIQQSFINSSQFVRKQADFYHLNIHRKYIIFIYHIKSSKIYSTDSSATSFYHIWKPHMQLPQHHCIVLSSKSSILLLKLISKFLFFSRTFVASQNTLPRKAFLASVTAVRCLFSVNNHMSPQRFFVLEILFAH